MHDDATVHSDDEPALDTPEAIDRRTQPVDDEDPPRLDFPVVGIGASAGGLEAVTEFIKAMRPDSGMAFVLIQHLPPDHDSLIAEILTRHTKMPVLQVEHGMSIELNHVYVIRPGHTLTMKNGAFHLGERVEKSGHNRPVDDFFRSLAIEQQERGIGIIMSGMGSNGTAGAQAIKAVGGLCIAQDPESAQFPSMPRHLIEAGYADYILRPADIPDMLLAYAGHPYASGAREASAGVLISRDRQHLREILAVLRTRTSQDFNGYKKPTLLRRVQRRMGLNRLEKIGEYAKLLRQSPIEVTALADDLLIHVTGFFRDPDAWEALRENAIKPLIAAREPGASIRCWVTACSSGEEAYSLAMLLVEESDRLDRPLDIKVFATDMAERTLQHARAGLYPGGIESEITADRLQRFFNREDAMYRVRPELRERVIFAPQNVLQDPPFSRLDIVSCRNLLIYLEPEVQQRVLSLLHFGLREGGTLFLGSSETTGKNIDEMFEAIDKKNRLFRRIGPTRHGSIDFPLPHAIKRDNSSGRSPTETRLPGVRPTMTTMTARALLESHTPAAVTVDRDGYIAYYHGDTEPFVASPRGEPTRDLLLLARETVRGSVRTALLRARSKNEAVTIVDGFLEIEPGLRHRVSVTASPLDVKNAPDFFVVSFQLFGESIPTIALSDISDKPDMVDELQRIRGELQSTIEELQTSNEELKASHEEVVSINEELQSTNEELETSREEMQSLNEELTTLNAQLNAKMEEHQAVSSDLTSLLASTDIAVLFLDPKFRIRRFTPQVLELLDILPTDIGRPLSDLARKFKDPDLIADAESVLNRLAPIEREISTDTGRWFLRRLTPYRTADNRIDGVVISFVEISNRRRTEQALRISEERLRGFAENSADGLWIADATEQKMEFVSPVFESILGIQRTTVLGDFSKWDAIVVPDDLDITKTHLQKLLSGEDDVAEYRVIRQTDGMVRTLRDTGFPIFDAGKVRRVGGITRDVTDERHVSEQLRDSEMRLRQAIEVENVGILFFGQAGEITYGNPAFLRMSGHSLQDFETKKIGWESVTAPAYIEQSRQAIEELSRSGRTAPYEKQFVRKDGSRWWGLVADARLNDQERVEFVVDISETRKAEVALRESEERFRMLVDGARDLAMIMTDSTGRITLWNEGATRLLGHTEAEAMGQNISMIFTDEDNAAGKAEEEMRNAFRDGRTPDERWHQRKDRTVFWGSGVTAALRNADDSVRGYVKVLRDETNRKHSEDAMQASKDAAELSNRVKDEFLATLSHELRTPLSSILIWSKLLRGSPSVNADNIEGLDAIMRSAEAQKQLIDDLLDTARITSGKLQLAMRETALMPLVQNAIEAIRPTAIAKDVEVIADLATDVGVVRADPDRLRQVIWNLLANAVKFTAEGGRVDVVLVRRGKSVEIRVTDNGKGIDPLFLPYVFEPFRQADASSTRTYGGLGLGLAICKQLVERHGGTITAASDGPGTGASFTVQLPLPKLKQQAVRASALTANAAGSLEVKASLAGTSVLLVEDEAETRAALLRFLTGAGAKVIAAESAAEAYALFEKGSPTLLLSDIGMAREDGYSLIQRIRRLEIKESRTPVPAVALTAFARDEDRDRALAAGFDKHVGKPVDPQHLLTVIRAALDKNQ